QGMINRPFLKDGIAAVAVGVIDDQVVLDPDYKEDKDGNADFNIVMTESGNIIEVHGGAEKEAISWKIFEQVCSLAREGIKELFTFFENNQPKVQSPDTMLESKIAERKP